MTDTEQSLLTLLRRALFGCELPLPSDVDWQRVFEEAVSHSVHLLVYDCLTEQERAAIPKETAALWRQEVLSAMWYNEQLLGEQQEVLKALSGLPCVILKGSSSAACYPRPELRCAGDIDLLLFPADVKKAEAILCAGGYCPPEDNHPFHRSMHREQFLVELHFEPPGIPLGASGAPLREYFQNAAGEGVLRGGLPVLPPERQAVLLLLHKLEHITSSGLGLRQLCDWAVFVHRDMTPERWEDLLPKLSRFGLLHFARVITRICVENLALPPEDAPWCMTANEGLCRALLEDILRTGNFGCKEERYGQRLFTDGRAENRLVSFFRTGVETCHTHWPACKEHPLLLPVAPAVLVLRYREQRKTGKRPPFRPLAAYRSAGERQKLYHALRPFEAEDAGGNGM